MAGIEAQKPGDSEDSKPAISTSSMSECADSADRMPSVQGRSGGPTRRSSKGGWTPEEDEILRKAVQCFKGKNWKRIAELLKDRSDVQCLHRWQKVLNPNLVKGPWTKEEDEKIMELVSKHGPKKWSVIARSLPGRIGKQCRERWHNHLDPNIKKDAWTPEEELSLIEAHQLHGNKWAEIAKCLPGRTDNAIKNHWNSSLKKKLESMTVTGSVLDQSKGIEAMLSMGEPVVGMQARGVQLDFQKELAARSALSSDSCTALDRLSKTIQVDKESPECLRVRNGHRHPGAGDLIRMTNPLFVPEAEGEMILNQSAGSARSLDSAAAVARGSHTASKGSNWAAVDKDMSWPRKSENGSSFTYLSGYPLQSCFERTPFDTASQSPTHVGSFSWRKAFQDGSRDSMNSIGTSLSPSKVEAVTNPSSPFDARTIMSSISCFTPPSHTWMASLSEISPQAVLRSAAKSFPGTPSILRKRSREVATPAQECSTSKKSSAVQEVHTSEKNSKANASRSTSNSSLTPDRKFLRVSDSPQV